MMDKVEQDFEAMLLRDLEEAKKKQFTEDELASIEFALNHLNDSIDKTEFEMSVQVESCEELIEKVRKM